MAVELYRLRWFLKGSISDSVHVLDDATNASSPQQAYLRSEDEEPHAVSTASLTNSPVSSLVVRVRKLDD